MLSEDLVFDRCAYVADFLLERDLPECSVILDMQLELDSFRCSVCFVVVFPSVRLEEEFEYIACCPCFLVVFCCVILDVRVPECAICDQVSICDVQVAACAQRDATVPIAKNASGVQTSKLWAERESHRFQKLNEFLGHNIYPCFVFADKESKNIGSLGRMSMKTLHLDEISFSWNSTRSPNQTKNHRFRIKWHVTCLCGGGSGVGLWDWDWDK